MSNSWPFDASGHDTRQPSVDGHPRSCEAGNDGSDPLGYHLRDVVANRGWGDGGDEPWCRVGWFRRGLCTGSSGTLERYV